LEVIQEFRDKIYELEEEKAKLEKTLKVDKEAEIKKLIEDK
jgi:hypothetical protein